MEKRGRWKFEWIRLDTACDTAASGEETVTTWRRTANSEFKIVFLLLSYGGDTVIKHANGPPLTYTYRTVGDFRKTTKPICGPIIAKSDWHNRRVSFPASRFYIGQKRIVKKI